MGCIVRPRRAQSSVCRSPPQLGTLRTRRATPPVAAMPSLRRVFSLCLLHAALAGCYTGEGSGVVAARFYDVADFTQIALSGEGQVTVVPGAFRVAASAEDNVLPTIRVSRQGERLLLRRDIDWIDGIRPTVPIEFRVSMPALTAVRVSGSGSVLLGAMASEALTLAVGGSGAMRLAGVEANAIALDVSGGGRLDGVDVRAGTLRAVVAGAGRVGLSGEAAQSVVRVSGSGLFRGLQLRSGKADVEVEGAGQALVWAEQELVARVGGKARLAYRGSPSVQSTLVREGELVRVLSAAPAP